MNPRSQRMLLLSTVLLLVGACTALSVQQPNPIRRAQFQVLSKRSALYLSVFRSGRLHAHSAGLNRNSRFFVHNEEKGKAITFESVKFRGRFLVMDLTKGKLRLQAPTNGNHLFQVVQVFDSIHVALKACNGCLVAFNELGEVSSDCVQNPHSIDTHVLIEAYRFL